MRGAALTLGGQTLGWIDDNGVPDLIVVTDMLDLAAYLAVIRRAAPGVPTAVYMHENQLCYPRQPGEPLDQGLAWATWRSLVVADAVWFNSDFHRRELLSALPAFLGAVTDHDHLHLMGSVEAKSCVVPVGIDFAAITDRCGRRVHDPAGPLILSNHRWHHDKDVGAILRAMLRLADRGLKFRVAVVGDERGGCADELMPLIERLGDRVEVVGQLERAGYLDLLPRCEIVVSAARNEFFGISIVEAIAAGAMPVLPRGLAYPEVIPDEFHGAVLYDRGGLTPALESAINRFDDSRAEPVGSDDSSNLAESMCRFGWDRVGGLHDDLVSKLVDRVGPL